ncbi:hypothetical protein [Amphibiibacter pelophylacis]|uniref:Uncharacterized protein n=1 Tax=Amphibiibacter pelophylacis TaxID=1799477 RepID=A0ACC6P6R0_9BURK
MRTDALSFLASLVLTRQGDPMMVLLGRAALALRPSPKIGT